MGKIVPVPLQPLYARMADIEDRLRTTLSRIEWLSRPENANAKPTPANIAGITIPPKLAKKRQNTQALRAFVDARETVQNICQKHDVESLAIAPKKQLDELIESHRLLRLPIKDNLLPITAEKVKVQWNRFRNKTVQRLSRRSAGAFAAVLVFVLVCLSYAVPVALVIAGLMTGVVYKPLSSHYRHSPWWYKKMQDAFVRVYHSRPRNDQLKDLIGSTRTDFYMKVSLPLAPDKVFENLERAHLMLASGDLNAYKPQLVTVATSGAVSFVDDHDPVRTALDHAETWPYFKDEEVPGVVTITAHQAETTVPAEPSYHDPIVMIELTINGLLLYIVIAQYGELLLEFAVIDKLFNFEKLVESLIKELHTPAR